MAEKEPKAVQCIGLILDGNRRWARERDLHTLEGHAKGFDLIKDTARWVRARNIPHMVFYGFSTENWGRAKEEVSYLMDLFRKLINETAEELHKEGVRIRFVGQRERFDQDLREGMDRIEEMTKDNTRLTVWACLSYGGRAEIVHAANRAAAEGDITEESIQKHLWTAGMPDPDIIVRTSGEQRLSGFLTWQGVYSELFFIKSHWPDFSEATLDEILAEYAERERRHGK
ncbi:MAG: di-trans,poly-cis-decaprenylcistransferase [Candidatus Pacebacteria bacterium]|nr:di-trans,poly-cis-decaprenylcistransferase [Candidatus Paceibacterota bacterium]